MNNKIIGFQREYYKTCKRRHQKPTIQERR